jgi:hypothetical protein
MPINTMKIILFLLGVLIPIGFGVLTWKKYDSHMNQESQTLNQFLIKLALVFGVVLLSMYGFFLFI